MSGFNHKTTVNAAGHGRFALCVALLWLWSAPLRATEIGPPGVYLDFAGDNEDRYQGRLAPPEFVEPLYFLLSDWTRARIELGSAEGPVSAWLSREMGDIWGGPGSYVLARGAATQRLPWFAGTLAPGRYALWVQSPEQEAISYTVFMTVEQRPPPDVWSVDLGTLSLEPVQISERLAAPVLTHRYRLVVEREVMLEAALGVTGGMPTLRILSADGVAALARSKKGADTVHARVTPGAYHVEVSGTAPVAYELTVFAVAPAPSGD